MRDFLLTASVAALGIVSSAAQAQTAPLAPVEQSSLAKDVFSTGLLNRADGAMDRDLWRGADPQTLIMLLDRAPARPESPAIGAALRRVLLSSGEAPASATPALGGAKLKALARAGFVDEARQIESLSTGGNDDPASVEAMAIADILSNDRDAACAKGRRMSAGRDNAFWIKLRVVCYADANELDAAELALGILRENGGLDAVDEALFSPLVAGGRPDATDPFAAGSIDAVRYAALKAMDIPVREDVLARADGGVVKAIADDEEADWAARLQAARRAAAMGVMSGAELKRLFAASPADAAPAFHDISAMDAPALLRDRAGRITAEIAAAADFDGLYATSLLYADEIRATEGAVLPPEEAVMLALARLAAGDAVGAERWLAAAAPSIANAPQKETLRFNDLIAILDALEPAAAARIAAAAGLEPPVSSAKDLRDAASSSALAPVVAAAIDAASRDGMGEAALAALAAADAAAARDPVGEAVLTRALAAGGLDDIVRRRRVDRAIQAIFSPQSSEGATAIPASAPGALTPRLKPKRST